MLISDSHQFIFVHIRKSAGTSIRKQIRPYAIERPTDLWAKLKSKSRIERDYHRFYFQFHSDINLARRTMPAEVFDRYFKFSFVRNPWARLVSEYEFIRKETTHGRHSKVIRMDFQSYIKYQSKRYEAHQINMLADKNGQLLMDFTGKFENLNEDWNYVCEKIDIPFKPLPHENSNRKVDYRDYYSDAEKKLVENLWKADIEAFGYKFE